MQQRGSDRLSPLRDDEMKHELSPDGRVEQTGRAEEWREPEPADAEDDPPLASGPVPPRGAGDVREAEDEAFRSDLARHLRRTAFPAKRGQLLHVLREEDAPEALVAAVSQLPARTSYPNVQAVVDALGRKPRA